MTKEAEQILQMLRERIDYMDKKTLNMPDGMEREMIRIRRSENFMISQYIDHMFTADYDPDSTPLELQIKEIENGHRQIKK